MSTGALRVAVEAVALCGPGLSDWASGHAVLSGHEPHCAAPLVLQAPVQLSAAERRRAVPSVKLALQVGAAAVAQSGRDAGQLAAVFASSGADGETIAAILAALETVQREVSPTRFHNSVHNAPSGYWGIAVQSREPVSSVSCHDASFAAGLLEAAVQAVAAERAILLVAYDLPYPPPLDQMRHIDAGFGVALVLRPGPQDASSRAGLAELRLSLTDGGVASGCADRGLEALRRGNPTARALPLLVMLAKRSSGTVRLDLSRGGLDVEVRPC
ncbi:beta-ketoacyl synthase chain length factor [Rhodopila sp.]|uniref:beta-ketoacyl synthase chain length factor n=1 Tax=Rhodopila sp. TaxID=2480087 RepID=UPI003D0DE586